MSDFEPIGEATYSPDDNKLRLRCDERLSSEDYQRARAAGFRWAPRQELFVAPRWTPEGEDLLIEWCGEIGDEDSSLVDRAEDRAARFEDYSEKREKDGDQAHAQVAGIVEHIPFGQPILVGHHSEKRARKDAERIDSGMRKALKMWETSKYWTDRAAGALAHARYLELPAVRARRIKRLEADRKRWVAGYTSPKAYEGETAMQKPISSCWRDHGHDAECVRCEKQEHILTGQGRAIHWTPTRLLPLLEKRAERWIGHLDRRLSYERAMLGEQGATHLLEKPKRPKAPPLLNYRGTGGAVELQNRWNEANDILSQQDMTKAEYKRVPTDYKGTSLSADGSHRVRVMTWRMERVAVYLTDSKDHGQPAAEEGAA